MQTNQDIPNSKPPKKLQDFIPLILTFLGALVVLSIYQNLSLYFSGVLDSVLNKSFFLLLLNHTGFVAITALILSFVFNFLENKKSDIGYKFVKITLILLVIIEACLIQYYVNNYEILGAEIISILESESVLFSTLPLLGLLVICFGISYYLHKITRRVYTIISRMYPFTIILFSLFLATLYADKKPVNENKTNYLLYSLKEFYFQDDTYAGQLEYPLLKDTNTEDVLSAYLNHGKIKPNFVILVIEGLGSDFVGSRARYKGFTPFLQSLTKESLYWENHFSNGGENFVAIPSLMGSLPFGNEGFTNLKKFNSRNTLYSILKNNGYRTSFNFGGNSAFNFLDKFLDEERVDRIVDKQDYGTSYILQEEDAAGFSLGYPDTALFKKFQEDYFSSIKPRLDVLSTLSTKNPYLIPEQKKFLVKVEEKLKSLPLKNREKKIISNNKELFASMLYTDKAIREFMTAFKSKKEYSNTIFLITGTHCTTDLPHSNALERYKVPLFLYSPLLKEKKTIFSLSSHADFTPSILAYLKNNYSLDAPAKNAWLGDALIHEDTTKQIPLIKRRNVISEYISGKYFISKKNVFNLVPSGKLHKIEKPLIEEKVKKNFKDFKAVNRYVTKNNKIIPDSLAVFSTAIIELTKQDNIWVESVFNGKDYDKAYITARNLAFNKDWDRALLLCKYILSKVPRHSDTEILVGRLHAWKKDYQKSIFLLEEVVRKYPKYDDGYSALLDVCFWANKNEKIYDIQEKMIENDINSKEISNQIMRAKKQLSLNSNI